MSNEVYGGNDFSVDTAGGDWAIWRFCDDDGNREQIILTQDGMDELRDYFAKYYPEDRDGIVPTGDDDGFDPQEAAAQEAMRDARMIAAQIDGDDVRVLVSIEPDASLDNEQRIHALVDLAIAKLRDAQAEALRRTAT